MALSNHLISLLDHQQACDLKYHMNNTPNLNFIPISILLLAKLSRESFAISMLDKSMLPKIRVNDIQIVDPFPGDFVVVKVEGKNEVVTCQYKKLSFIYDEYELMTLNVSWSNIKLNRVQKFKY